MSKLEELIQELCPNGVPFVKLEELCLVMRGKRLTKSQLSDDGQYVVYHGSKDTPLGFYDDYNVEGDTVIVVNTGGIGGVKYIKDNFWCSDGSFWIKHNDRINNKFLYYYLIQYEGYYLSQKRVGGVPTIDKSVVSNTRIPVPPLEVQCEIVRILDKFTLLTAELTAELTARRKQYEYYFIKILNENSYKKIKLGDIGQVKMCKRILKVQTNNKCGIPFYKIGTFGKEADTFIDNETFEEYKSKYSYPRKGDVLISCSGTIGRTVIFDGKPAYFQDSNIVWLEHDSSKVLNDYLFYYYKTTPWVIPTGGTIARLYNDNILKTEISIPTIEKQKEIVSKLKYFDKLCNDITNGLPAEIGLRQKQYEYYRDKLLTFKEKNNE